MRVWPAVAEEAKARRSGPVRDAGLPGAGLATGTACRQAVVCEAW